MKAMSIDNNMALTLKSHVTCADNSGAKEVYIIAVFKYKGNKRAIPQAGIGSLVHVVVHKGKPEMRGKGLGKIILSFLGKLAVERNCGRLEWWCIDWNESSIKFYKEMGAKPMDEWTVYRVDDSALKDLANEF